MFREEAECSAEQSGALYLIPDFRENLSLRYFEEKDLHIIIMIIRIISVFI